MIQSADSADNYFFLTGLMTSLVVHIVMIGLLSLSHAKISSFSEKFNALEVTYQDLKQLAPKKKEIVVKDLKVTKESKPAERQKIEVLSKNDGMFAAIGQSIKDISKLTGQLMAGQKKTPKISVLDIDRKITLMPITSAKITNPKYLSYNDGMHATIERNIKQRAYLYVNHPDFQSGKVYLTFVLANSGELKQLKIIEEKTEANDYLKHVALKSIQESSPFPPFPIGFNYPEFTFNLLISFQD